MAETKVFKAWVRVHVAREEAGELEVAEKVDSQLREIKVEVRRGGKWIEVSLDDDLTD